MHLGGDAVTGPYNSAPAYTPAVQPAPPSPASATRPAYDHIAHLDVGDYWKKRFREIERSGAIERGAAAYGTNWRAFFLGPIYFLAKGLWRQAIVYYVLAVALGVVLHAMGFGKGVRFAMLFVAGIGSMRANLSYYRKVVLDEAPWF